MKSVHAAVTAAFPSQTAGSTPGSGDFTSLGALSASVNSADMAGMNTLVDAMSMPGEILSGISQACR